MDNDVDLELAKLPGSKGYNQHHKIHLKASHQHCAPCVPKLFNSFINDLDDCTERALSKSTDYTKVTDKPSGYCAIQRDINRLEKWQTVM